MKEKGSRIGNRMKGNVLMEELRNAFDQAQVKAQLVKLQEEGSFCLGMSQFEESIPLL